MWVLFILKKMKNLFCFSLGLHYLCNLNLL